MTETLAGILETLDETLSYLEELVDRAAVNKAAIQWDTGARIIPFAIQWECYTVDLLSSVHQVVLHSDEGRHLDAHRKTVDARRERALRQLGKHATHVRVRLFAFDTC